MKEGLNLILFGATSGVGRSVIKNLIMQPGAVTLHIVLSNKIREKEVAKEIDLLKNEKNIDYFVYTQEDFFKSEFTDLSNIKVIYCWGVFDLDKIVDTSPGQDNTKNYLDINYLLLKKVVLHFHKIAAHINSFIFISSQAAGENIINHHLFNQIDYQQYGLSKKLAENYLSLIAKNYGYNVVIIRPGTLVGKGDKEHRLIGQIVINTLNDKVSTVIGTESRRNYLSFNNVAKICLFFAEKKTLESFKIYNISGEYISTIREIAEICVKHLSNSFNLAPRIDYKFGLRTDVLFENDLIELGFRQEMDIEEAIRESIEFHLGL
jgi:nucleoside-diphosphate-sugar epimerase